MNETSRRLQSTEWTVLAFIGEDYPLPLTWLPTCSQSPFHTTILRCLSINPMTFVDDDVTVRKRFHRCKVHKYRSSWGVATLGLPAGISDVFLVCLQRCITFGILIKAWVDPICIIPMTRWRRTGVSHSSSVFVIVDMWQAICHLNRFYTLIARTSAVVHEARACHVFVYSPKKTLPWADVIFGLRYCSFFRVF